MSGRCCGPEGVLLLGVVAAACICLPGEKGKFAIACGCFRRKASCCVWLPGRKMAGGEESRVIFCHRPRTGSWRVPIGIGPMIRCGRMMDVHVVQRKEEGT